MALVRPCPAPSLILHGHSEAFRKHTMSDWEQRLKAAETDAERSEVAESAAEERFKAVKAKGDHAAALDSDEFSSWMATRHATDAAWGTWATVMDAKPA